MTDYIKREDALRQIAGFLSAEMPELHHTHPGSVYDALLKALAAALPGASPVSEANKLEMTGESRVSRSDPGRSAASERVGDGHRHDDGTSVGPSSPASKEHPQDWPEDFPHENGRYMCTCVECGIDFMGHKRRVVCKVCAKPVSKEQRALWDKYHIESDESFTECVERNIDGWKQRTLRAEAALQPTSSEERERLQPHFDALTSAAQYFTSNGMIEDFRKLDAAISAFGRALLHTPQAPVSEERPYTRAEEVAHLLEIWLNTHDMEEPALIREAVALLRALAERAEAMEEYIEEIKRWQKAGEHIGLGGEKLPMFWLGGWWADRPWRNRAAMKEKADEQTAPALRDAIKEYGKQIDSQAYEVLYEFGIWYADKAGASSVILSDWTAKVRGK
jgi:tetratricopeptide (TPR) repeat protein